MKLGVSHQKPEMITADHLVYLKRMGVESLEVRTTSDGCSYDEIVAIKEKVEGAGLHVHEIMLNDKYSCPEITLGLPERQVHFRNINNNMPNFNETFPDDGYVDMVAVFRALAEVGFDGMVVPDHVPNTPDGLSGEAFIFGYTRALIQMVK